jgi:RNA polymerase sigma factor (sigma-70 family)
MSTHIDSFALCNDPFTLAQLDKLVRTHSGRLNSFVRRRIGNPSDVEDIVQDTLLEAVRCLDRFQGNSKPETWLFGIALNLTRNHYKRAKLRDVYSDVDTDDLASEPAENPLEIVDYRERLQRVAKAVGQLSDDTLELMEFIFDDEMSYQEIASRIGVPVGTVRSRVSRTRSALRRHADGYEQAFASEGDSSVGGGVCLTYVAAKADVSRTSRA